MRTPDEQSLIRVLGSIEQPIRSADTLLAGTSTALEKDVQVSQRLVNRIFSRVRIHGTPPTPNLDTLRNQSAMTMSHAAAGSWPRSTSAVSTVPRSVPSPRGSGKEFSA